MDWRPFLLGPLRAFRDRYVASFGGLSYDLAPGALGVHPDHLARVPELEGRLVLVSHEGSPAKPLHCRPAFTVVTLDRRMRDARERVETGGVVFSVFDLEDPIAGPLVERMGPGEAVYLNAALDRFQADVVRRPGLAS